MIPKLETYLKKIFQQTRSQSSKARPSDKLPQEISRKIFPQPAYIETALNEHFLPKTRQSCLALLIFVLKINICKSIISELM